MHAAAVLTHPSIHPSIHLGKCSCADRDEQCAGLIPPGGEVPATLAAAVAQEAAEAAAAARLFEEQGSPRRLCSIGDGLVLREDEPLWRWWDQRYGAAVPSSPDANGDVPIVQ